MGRSRRDGPRRGAADAKLSGGPRQGAHRDLDVGHAPRRTPGAVDRPGRHRRPAGVALRSGGRDPTPPAFGPWAGRWMPSAAWATSACRHCTSPCAPRTVRSQLDTIFVRSNVASIDGGGRLQLRPGTESGHAPLRAVLGDLGPVAALMGSDTLGADSARARLDITGPAWHWKLNGAADAYGLAFGGNLANHVTLSGAATLDSTRVDGVAGDLRVTDAAYGRLSLRELTRRRRLRFDPRAGSQPQYRRQRQGRHRASAGAISSARDTVRAELQRLTLEEGGRELGARAAGRDRARPPDRSGRRSTSARAPAAWR